MDVLDSIGIEGRAKKVQRARARFAGYLQADADPTFAGLERDGLVTRTVYDTKPPSVAYSLNELGWSFMELRRTDARRALRTLVNLAELEIVCLLPAGTLL